MWRRPYRADLLLSRFESGCSTWLARHNGYGHLGITHWRGLIHQRGEFLAVWDFLEGVGDQPVAVHWHLGVPARVSPDGQNIDLEYDSGLRLAMEIRGGVAILARGSESPMAGWRSVAYAEREPCDVIRVSARGKSKPVLTVVWLAASGSVDSLMPRFSEFEACLLAASGR
jgi:hypothetical protein